MSKVVAIIQARMGSTRLPDKVMKDLFGKTVLSHVINRVKQSKIINEIVIATTMAERDNIIVQEAKNSDVKYFVGSEDDVLSRYYYSAKEYDADVVVRITSDCPLIDPIVIDEMLKHYQNNRYDFVTNAGPDLSKRTYPRGLDIEIFSFEILEDTFHNARLQYQREHVTPYIYENINKIYYYKNDIDYSMYRLTLDTEEDLVLIQNIYKGLYKDSHNFYLDEIVNFLKQNPSLARINEHVEQKKIK